MSLFHITASNLMAANPLLTDRQRMKRKPKLCWQCQKEKSTIQGHLLIKEGLHLFVCKDCLDFNLAKKEKLNTEDANGN